MQQIVARTGRLRMALGIAGDLDAELRAGALPDEFDQLRGVAQLADGRRAGR
jgi:hypothetical protein